MAEVGSVRFAHVAREVAAAVLPSYRSKCSKHLFTQPSLLAILCLMSYKDWTSREAEVRLEDRGEHQELRTALGVERVPDYTTLYRFLRRVGTEVVTHAFMAAVARLPPSALEGTVVAIDAAGLAPTAAGHFFTLSGPLSPLLPWTSLRDVAISSALAPCAHQPDTYMDSVERSSVRGAVRPGA